MLGGLLKPSWQHKLAEKRLQAVNKLTSAPDDQTILSELALNDSEQKVQLACIKKLSDLSTLAQLLNVESNGPVFKAAKQRFIEVIGPNTNVDNDRLESLLAEHPNCSALLAEYSPNSELRHRLIEQLTQTQMAALIAEVAYLETRKLIAERLSEVSALEIARKNLKGKDKSSEKIIRQKLDHIRKELKKSQADIEKATQLCEQIEFIANHPEWRAEFKDRFKLYQQRWSALNFNVPQTIQERFETATQLSQTKVDAQTSLENSQASQAQLVNKLEQYCHSLALLDLPLLIQEQSSVNSILSDSIHTWLEDGKRVTAAAKTANRFSKAQNALSTLSELIGVDLEQQDQLAKAIRHVSWPSNYPKLKGLTQAKKHLEDQKAQSAQLKKDLKHNLDKLHQRINRLIGTTNKGNIRRAKQELSATTKASERYQGRERIILNERLEKAAETVNKMSDWQAFATEPKLVELCEAMEALNGVKIHPDKLAKQISDLQNRWKSLGHADITDAHWPRFKIAADTAYEPCAKFFEERKATRAENLKKREPLLAKAQALLDNTDWESEVDYKQIETHLRNINNDWRKIKDVERRAGQKQWERLSKIKNAIFAKLDVVYDANIDLKKKLIQQVSVLSERKVDEGTIAKLQLFQSRWKQVGVTRRKQDQDAWLEFKAASDKVYEQVQNNRQSVRDEQDKELDAYRNIIKAMSALAKSSDSLSDLEKSALKLQTNYQALPSFTKNIPEKLIEKIDADYQRALNLVTKSTERLTAKKKSAKQSLFKEIATLCTELEAVSAKNEDEINDLKNQINELLLNDKSLQRSFSERVKNFHTNERDAYTRARHELCIELEILFNVDSPESDRNQRMQMQLARMQNKGLGTAAKTAEQLQMDWWCQPGAEPRVQALLEVRVAKLTKP